MKNRLIIIFVLISSSCIFNVNGAGKQLFLNKEGSGVCEHTFTVPAGVQSVRVVAVGGGAGGTNGAQSGGAGGYVKCGTFPVKSGENIKVVVGFGGFGALKRTDNDILNCEKGEPSKFGDLLVAEGGGGCSTSLNGHDGGTGSGAPCWGSNGGRCKKGSMGGKGGSGGRNGGKASDGTVGGKGQGSEYTQCLKTAKYTNLTAGAGGEAVEANCIYRGDCWAPGGGGGGVRFDGKGNSARDGRCYKTELCGVGGHGQGAGGGGGGLSRLGGKYYRYAGGNGEDGLVYVEWD